jgi:hypothetical protein
MMLWGTAEFNDYFCGENDFGSVDKRLAAQDNKLASWTHRQVTRPAAAVTVRPEGA